MRFYVTIPPRRVHTRGYPGLHPSLPDCPMGDVLQWVEGLTKRPAKVLCPPEGLRWPGRKSLLPPRFRVKCEVREKAATQKPPNKRVPIAVAGDSGPFRRPIPPGRWGCGERFILVRVVASESFGHLRIVRLWSGGARQFPPYRGPRRALSPPHVGRLIRLASSTTAPISSRPFKIATSLWSAPRSSTTAVGPAAACATARLCSGGTIPSRVP